MNPFDLYFERLGIVTSRNHNPKDLPVDKSIVLNIRFLI